MPKDDDYGRCYIRKKPNYDLFLNNCNPSWNRLESNKMSQVFTLKKSLDDMKELAREVGIEKTGVEGECLSKEYKNMHTALEWRCGKCGYEFIKTPDKVKYRREWCPRCSGSPRFLHNQITIEDMQKLAYDVGIKKTGVPGLCLSNKYINSSTELKWYCGKCGNIFEKRPNDVKSKLNWCTKCSGREQSIEDMQKLAYDVGIKKTGVPGRCLSKEYKGATTKLWWKCGKCEYKFPMTPNKVKSRRSWCPKCAHKVPPTIIELNKLAQEVGIEKTGSPGKILSRKYKGSNVKHRWFCGKCKESFDKTVNKVKNRRSWCLDCSQGYYEKICRGFMEHIFSYLYKKEIKFPQTTLDQIVIAIDGREGLKNYHPLKIGFDITQMHLDGFNFEIMVGFERQGKQHYIRVPEWQKTDRKFQRQNDIDEFKQYFSDFNGILLIIIGYEQHNGVLYRIEPEEMQDQIIKQIEAQTGKKLPPFPKFNYKEFLRETLEDEVRFRRKLGEKLGFNFLTDFQRRILQEFSKGTLFASDLLKMNHLKDIKSLDWMIRDLFNKGYLQREIAFNPYSLANKKKQYKYNLSKLGKNLLDLSSN